MQEKWKSNMIEDADKICETNAKDSMQYEFEFAFDTRREREESSIYQKRWIFFLLVY